LDGNPKAPPVDKKGWPFTKEGYESFRVSVYRPHNIGNNGVPFDWSDFSSLLEVLPAIFLQAYKTGKGPLFCYKLRRSIRDLGADFGLLESVAKLPNPDNIDYDDGPPVEYPFPQGGRATLPPLKDYVTYGTGMEVAREEFWRIHKSMIEQNSSYRKAFLIQFRQLGATDRDFEKWLNGEAVTLSNTPAKKPGKFMPRPRSSGQSSRSSRARSKTRQPRVRK
jgi:hypothetical protein